MIASKTSFASILMALFATVSFVGCSKNKDDAPASAYPKEVNIEYKAFTSVTAGIEQINISYTHDNNGSTTELSPDSYPFSEKLAMTVNQAGTRLWFTAESSYTSEVATDLTVQILVDGKVVAEKQTASSNNKYIPAVTSYAFE
ncbi:MAG: hypothetical protein ACTHMM_02210 [Agriterribacter sp.]